MFMTGKPECPRCKLTLQSEEYEGVASLFCDSCWGHWLTRDAFTKILKNEQYRFSDIEKESVLRGWAEKETQTDLDPIVTCPICKQKSERKPFAEDCSVILDICHDHGVWFDASEIKQVQTYFDSLED